MTAVDLCCGAGGWAVAARGFGVRWLAVVDIDHVPLSTWRANHAANNPDCRVICGDLTDRQTREQLADLRPDLVVGGIPCEQVSVARGSKKASLATLTQWHKLIDAMFDTVTMLWPQYWCFEDVIQVEKHLPLPINGLAFRSHRIDAKHYGPQRRERSYIGQFPSPAAVPTRDRRRLSDCWLPGPFAQEVDMDNYRPISIHGSGNGRVGHDLVRVIETDDVYSPTVMCGTGRGSRQRRNFYRRLQNGRLARLTWQELALIQGFPQDYIFHGPTGRIESQIGRAIPIDVGREIFRAMNIDFHRKRNKEGSAC